MSLLQSQYCSWWWVGGGGVLLKSTIISTVLKVFSSWLIRGVFRCVVIGVEEEEQWGENAALRGASSDGESSGGEFAQPNYLLPVCQEADDPLTDGGGHRELCEFVWEKVRHDGIEGRADVHK